MQNCNNFISFATYEIGSEARKNWIHPFTVKYSTLLLLCRPPFTFTYRYDEMAFVARHGGVALLRRTQAFGQVAICFRQMTPNFGRTHLPFNMPCQSARFMANMTPPTSSPTPSTPPENVPDMPPPSDDALKLLWDGGCPLCAREVNFLRRRCARYDLSPLIFVDVDSLDYSPEENGGISYEEAMGKIAAIRRDGTVLVGIDAFKEAYERIDLGYVYALTNVPLIKKIAESAYGFWAKRRLSWTGRPPIDELVILRDKKKSCR